MSAKKVAQNGGNARSLPHWGTRPLGGIGGRVAVAISFDPYLGPVALHKHVLVALTS